MKQVNIKNRKILIYVLAFTIPIAVMAIVSIFLHMYPFGDTSILVADLNYQFVDYYSYFKSVILENNDFSYTFSKNLGGSMAGFVSYYLQSPFNFLYLLFPENKMPLAVLIVIVLKMGLCGLTFSIYLNKVHTERFASLIFSTGYALMAYLVAYINNTIFLDNIILLPLIALGIHQLAKNPQNKYLYVLSLAAAAVTNYYITFMCCMFAVIYFIYEIVLSIDYAKQLKERISVIVTFAVSSIAAMGIAAFSLIPTVISLQGEKSSFSTSVFYFGRNFKMIDLFSKLYSNSFNGNISDGLPNICCGMLILVLIVLFLFNKNISVKERIISLGTLTVIAVCFYINTFNLILHGFNPPIGFPYRYSFIFSFLMLIFAYKGYLNLPVVMPKKQLTGFLAVYIIYSGYLLASKNAYVGLKEIIIGLIVIVISMAIIIGFYRKQLNTRQFLLLLLTVQVVDLSVNAYTSVSKYTLGSMSEYSEFSDTVKPIIDKVQQDDREFYRMEKTFRRTHNDAMQFGYNGLSHFSSCEKDFVKAFMGKMGFRNNENWAYYNHGSTSFTDSLLGVKYLISQYPEYYKPYTITNTLDRYHIYQNPYALPIGFAVTEDMLHVDMKNDNLFEIQNNIAAAMTPEPLEVHTQAEVIDIVLTNLKEKKEGSNTIYEKIDASKEAYLEYHVRAVENGALYTYISAPEKQDVEIFIDDISDGIYFATYRWDIIGLKKCRINDEVIFKIKPENNQLIISDYYFYSESDNRAKEWFDSASKNSCKLEKITSSHLVGSVKVVEERPYIMFSIPQENAWSILIDGKEVKTIRMLNALMAVKAEPGLHTIEMKYTPDGFKVGLWISLISISLVVMNFIYTIYRRGRK